MLKLQIEWLPTYKMYRVWNSEYEDWYDTKGEVLKGITEFHRTVELYTYDLDDFALGWFAKNGIEIEVVGEPEEKKKYITPQEIWTRDKDKVIEQVEQQLNDLFFEYGLTLDNLETSRESAIKSIFYKVFRHFTKIPKDAEYLDEDDKYINDLALKYLNSNGEQHGE